MRGVHVFLPTLEFWLWTALMLASAGAVLRLLSRNFFLNFLGWAMLASILGLFLVGPVWLAHAYGFEALLATLGVVLLIMLGVGLWLLLWLRRSVECIG